MTGWHRRTLKKIQYYPEPSILLQQLQESKGWPYQSNTIAYMKRDRALIALLYLLALRISEALKLTKGQFSYLEKDRVNVKAIQLSKATNKGKLRKEQYRQENFLPLVGQRKEFTLMVLDYLDSLPSDPKTRLFNFGTKRAWQILSVTLGIPCHWLRAYGENFLYELFGNDILAVSDFVKVDVTTLQQYIRGRFKRYKIG